MRKTNRIVIITLLLFLAGTVFAQSAAYFFKPPQNNFYVKWKDYNGTTHFLGYINGDLWNGNSGGEEYFSSSKGTSYRRDGNKWYLDDYYSANEVKEQIARSIAEPEMLGLYFTNFWNRYNTTAGGTLKAELYHKGRERFLGINCDIFVDNMLRKYWVDPSNGCTLKMADGSGKVGYEVTEYNLNFTRWPAGLPPG